MSRGDGVVCGCLRGDSTRRFFAASEGRLDAAKMLIDAGADACFTDDDGFSPYACCSVWSQCVAKERPKSLDDTPVEYNGASPLV